MPITIARGQTDEVIETIMEALRRYQADHPEAAIDLYRQNQVSVRIRVIDPTFVGKGRSQRSEYVWKYLEKIPEEAVSDISTVLLLAPEETEKSFANMDFDNPIPSEF